MAKFSESFVQIAFILIFHFLNLGSYSSLINSEFQEKLDEEGNVLLGWSIDEASLVITFEFEVATVGFVGFGISPTGGMKNADMFIAGVLADGTSYSGVCYLKTCLNFKILN
jgi:hypothetical protein